MRELKRELDIRIHRLNARGAAGRPDVFRRAPCHYETTIVRGEADHEVIVCYDSYYEPDLPGSWDEPAYKGGWEIEQAYILRKGTWRPTHLSSSEEKALIEECRDRAYWDDQPDDRP
jgi:hypothetical protein